MPEERRIDRVLAELDRIVDRSRGEGSRLGFFAALYRRVTRKVKEGIETPGFFDDPERMDRLDFVFAGRYLEALRAYRKGGELTASWLTAFDAAGHWRPVILQQLVLGINAHINLDLGIAAARVSPGPALASLHRDFDKINSILNSLVASVEREIGGLSPWIALGEKVAGETGVRLVEFSMGVARDEAWELAERLAPLPPAEQAPLVAARDREIDRLARTVLHPGWLLDAALLVVRLRETNDVRRAIDVLSGDDPPVTEMV